MIALIASYNVDNPWIIHKCLANVTRATTASIARMCVGCVRTAVFQSSLCLSVGEIKYVQLWFFVVWSRADSRTDSYTWILPTPLTEPWQKHFTFILCLFTVFMLKLQMKNPSLCWWILWIKRKTLTIVNLM